MQHTNFKIACAITFTANTTVKTLLKFESDQLKTIQNNFCGFTTERDHLIERFSHVHAKRQTSCKCRVTQ